MKIFISVDMEGISGLTYWREKEEKLKNLWPMNFYQWLME